jgi:hypothetical protein
MSSFSRYYLYTKYSIYFKYVAILCVLWISTFLFDIHNTREIRLLKKEVVCVHKKDISLYLYYMDFYYVNHPDIIYHHAKQPLDIWKQVCFRKENTDLNLDLGKDKSSIIIGILAVVILFALTIVCIIFDND